VSRSITPASLPPSLSWNRLASTASSPGRKLCTSFAIEEAIGTVATAGAGRDEVAERVIRLAKLLAQLARQLPQHGRPLRFELADLIERSACAAAMASATLPAIGSACRPIARAVKGSNGDRRGEGQSV
jgi:hypothetical protein